MKRQISRIGRLSIGLACGLAAAFGLELFGRNSAKIRIVASILPLYEFARSVVGDRGEVTLLLPPGAGVHTWQPRASDIIRIHSAHLFVSIGGGLEPWLDDILHSLPPPKPEVLTAAEFLRLIEDEHDHSQKTEVEEGKKHSGLDPHVWLDFELDQVLVSRLAEALSRLDPSHAAFYRTNSNHTISRLAELHRKYEKGLLSCRQRVLLLGGHAAFSYLARKYRLEQVSLYGLSPDAEPAPGRMMSAIRMAREKGIKAVFVEANTNDRMARVLAREIGAELLVLNPGSNLTRKELTSGLTFFAIMEENLRTMRKGLGCE
ncbi:MAG: zinc ABC transporter substrate-binding protein [Clostridiales bacterium]|nr:zinc ABC transporter substrate-binding protein [Clostridiales bacterium]